MFSINTSNFLHPFREERKILLLISFSPKVERTSVDRVLCGKLSNSPGPKVHIVIPESCEYLPYIAKGSLLL
jgi:hypothetical protein